MRIMKKILLENIDKIGQEKKEEDIIEAIIKKNYLDQ